MIKTDVVGPICESGDFFAKDRPLPRLDAGEYVALLSAGAYGFVMASTYNTALAGGRSFGARQQTPRSFALANHS